MVKIDQHKIGITAFLNAPFVWQIEALRDIGGGNCCNGWKG